MKIIPYRHPKFEPGTMVYISSSIREEYPLCPLADQAVKVTKEWISLSAFLYILRSDKQVPVKFEKATWFVEEEYVRPLYSVPKQPCLVWQE